jgi:predicted cupin superfamily sugar epimerase
MITSAEIIERLQLVPLTIEGGYFRETHRSELLVPAAVLPAEYGGQRNVSTAIYYLLTPDTFSAIHRVKCDEVFHYYAGEPPGATSAIEMLQLDANGRGRIVTIGNDLAADQRPQLVVPGGLWQGCRLIPGGNWALMGCTVAPGFDYADFTAGNRAELIAQYPDHAELITALTKE